MKRLNFEEAMRMILKEDPRYPLEAYVFLRLALDFTIRTLNKPAHGPARHITGQELLDGIRLYALKEFGPITRTVLEAWGITQTDDFGNLVFNLVSHGVLGKTDQDKKEDFANGYSFQAAFTEPFLPFSLKDSAKPVKRKRTTRTQIKKPS
ncbi:MAG: Minf_1886 family protein [bacterium]